MADRAELEIPGSFSLHVFDLSQLRFSINPNKIKPILRLGHISQISRIEKIRIGFNNSALLIVPYCTGVEIEIIIDNLILTIALLNCLLLFFIHLKLELLTQFPASTDEK